MSAGVFSVRDFDRIGCEDMLGDTMPARGMRLEMRPVVLFDFDGTVADTQPAIFQVVGEVLFRHGYALSHEQMLPLIGPPLEEGIQLICDIGPDEALVVASEYRLLFERTVTAAEVPLLPGMSSLLDGLRARGCRLAIATSRLEKSAVELIRMLGVTQFDAIAGRVQGVRYSKSESIAAALDMLGASPDRAVMIGDRKYDVLGAASLGIPCIGLYSGAAEPGELEDAGAVAVCHSVPEIGPLLGL